MDYSIKGIRTLGYLYPSNIETSRLIVKNKGATCGRIDKHYHCNSKAELARKIFREFLIRVIDIIVAEQALFILPGKSGSYIYALTKRDKIGKTCFAGLKYSFGVKSRKRDLSIVVPDIFYNILWENAKEGKVYPRLLKT
jgi:hypothetical protein